MPGRTHHCSLNFGRIPNRSSFYVKIFGTGLIKLGTCRWKLAPRNHTALPAARRGSLPPHVSRVRAAIDSLRHLVSMPLFYTNHRHFFRNLEILDELASSCTSFGSTLEWPAMILFGSDLSELVSLRRIDTLSFSLDPF